MGGICSKPKTSEPDTALQENLIAAAQGAAIVSYKAAAGGIEDCTDAADAKQLHQAGLAAAEVTFRKGLQQLTDSLQTKVPPQNACPWGPGWILLQQQLDKSFATGLDRLVRQSAEVAQLKLQLQIMSCILGQQAPLLNQLQAATCQTNAVESAVEAQQQKISFLSVEQEKLQQQLEAAKAEFKALQVQTKREAGGSNSEIEQLQSQMEKSKEREADLLQENLHLAGELSSQKTILMGVYSELAGAKEDVQRLQEQLEELKSQIHNAQSAYAQLLAVHQQLQQDSNQQQQELTQQRLQCVQSQKQNHAQQNELQLSQQKNDALTKEQQGIQKQLKAAVAEVAGLRLQLEETLLAYQKESQAVAALETTVKQLQSHLGQSKEQEYQLQRQIASLEHQLSSNESETATVGDIVPGYLVNHDIDPKSMTVNQLKAWVSSNGLEDDEFFKMAQSSKTKRQDWIKYVQKKLA